MIWRMEQNPAYPALFDIYDEDGNAFVTCKTKEMAALITEAPSLLALVEAVEWVKQGRVMICPWCKWIRAADDRHAPDCPRQRALKRARGGGAEEE